MYSNNHIAGACGSVRCDAGQCTNGCGFDSHSTCARLLYGFIFRIGFQKGSLRTSFIFTIPRNVSFSSACCVPVAVTAVRAVPAEKSAKVISATILAIPIITGA